MDYGLAFFVVFRQRPRADALRVARAKTRSAIGVKDVAGFRFVKHRPNFQAVAKLPTASVQHGAAPENLRGLALIFSAFREKVDGFLARHFQSNRFESSVHMGEV